jgi:hypothetical protein
VVDIVSTVSIAVAFAAAVIAGLIWYETRKQRELLEKQGKLLETLTRSIPLITPRRRAPRSRTVDPARANSSADSSIIARQTQPLITSTPLVPRRPTASELAEQRRLAKIELEREKLQWRKNKDVAKAIGWFLDRLDSDDNYDE